MSNLFAPYQSSPTGKQSILYHTSWSKYGRNFQVKDLSADNITDVAYAFFNLESDGRVFSGDTWADFEDTLIGKGVEPQNSWSSPAEDLGNLGQFNKLRKQGKKFNFFLSVGGWSWSGKFSDAVATATSRQTLVDSLSALFKKYPGLFTGVSLDWEYLSDDGKNYGLETNKASPADATNFIALLKLLRSTFGNSCRLSFCVSAAPEKIKMPVKDIHPLLDEIHIMTYDFHDGNWGELKSGHHTNLRQSPHGVFSCEEATAAWLGYGVPSKKLFIGAAFYSRGFSNTDGIGKASSGGSSDKSWENGIVDYKSLPLTGAVEMWDDVARAGYSYDASKRVLNSYDTVQSVKEKCQFVHDNDLGGILVWETSGDHPYNHAKSLTKVLHDCLTHGKPSGITPQPKVIPTVPGGTFKPNRGGSSPTPAPTPTPVPVPIPSPTPAPSPATRFSCDFCSTCTKSSNIPCKAKSNNPVPTPAPAPVPTPSPTTNVSSWVVGQKYVKNDKVSHNGKIYVCLLSHTSLPAFRPDAAASLWKIV